MFDSTNYPHDVDYTSRQIKPVVKQAVAISFEDIKAINLTLAEKDYQHDQYMRRQAEISQLDGLWSEVLAS